MNEMIKCYFKDDLSVPVDSRVNWRLIITAEGSSLDHVAVEIRRRGGQLIFSYSAGVVDCLRHCPACYIQQVLEVLAILNRQLNIEDIAVEEED